MARPGHAPAPGAASAADLVVLAGGRRLRVPAGQVRAIARMPRLTPVPGAPAALLGLGSFRGEVLAVLALGDPASPARTALILDGTSCTALAVERVERLASNHSIHETDAAIDALATAESLLPQPDAALRHAARNEPVDRAAPAAPPRDETVSLLVLGLDGQRFALPLSDVEAVFARPREVATTPEGHPASLGTCTFRNAPLALVDLAPLLALPGGGGARGTVVVVARLGTVRAGLVVPEVHGVLRLPRSRLDPVPDSIAAGPGEARVQSIARSLRGSLVAVLDSAALLDEALAASLGAATDMPARSRLPVGRKHEAASHLLVRIAGRGTALPLAAVDRVARWPGRLTRLPGAPAAMPGIALIDGAAVPLVDPGHQLAGTAAAGIRRRVVTVRAGGAVAGVIVEAVEGLIAAAAERLDRTSLPDEAAHGLFAETVRLSGTDDTVLLLGPEALVAATASEVVGLGRASAAVEA